MNLLAVPPEQVGAAWPLAEKYVRAAEEETGFVETEDVHVQLLLGNALLWLAAEGTKVVGAGVTRLVTVKGEKCCEIYVWGCDDQKKCAPLLKTIEDFGRAEHCVEARLLGRRGWARMLPDYRMEAVLLTKAL